MDYESKNNSATFIVKRMRIGEISGDFADKSRPIFDQEIFLNTSPEMCIV